MTAKTAAKVPAPFGTFPCDSAKSSAAPATKFELHIYGGKECFFTPVERFEFCCRVDEPCLIHHADASSLQGETRKTVVTDTASPNTYEDATPPAIQTPAHQALYEALSALTDFLDSATEDSNPAVNRARNELKRIAPESIAYLAKARIALKLAANG